MDRKKSWEWMKEHMPTVVAMLREYRDLGEGAFVDRCWHNGVVLGLPNWLYAREGVIAVGVPFDGPRPPILGSMEQCELARSGVLLQLAPLGFDLAEKKRNARATGGINGAH